MKILFLGAFGSGALEHYYVRGFSQFEVRPETFDTTAAYYSAISKSLFNKVLNKISPSVFFKAINDEVLQYCKGKQYDVILIFKGLTIFPDTIRALKKHTKLIACYNPDHPFRFYSPGSGNKNVSDSIKLYDLYINYANSVSAELKSAYGVATETIPFGYDDRSFLLNPDKFASLKDKILFVGSYDADRARWLNALAAGELALYGDQKWSTRTAGFPSLRKAFTGQALYGDDYKSASAAAVGCLNILRQQNIEEESHNMRTFEVPGYGGVLIAHRTNEQLGFFEEDKEAVFFNSPEELADKIHYLRNNPSVVQAMKVAAQERSVRSGYSYTHRSRQLYNTFLNYLK